MPPPDRSWRAPNAELEAACSATCAARSIFTTELFRQAAITEFLGHFLRTWSSEDDRVAQVSFESLCRDPLGETVRLYDFLDLDYDDDTLSAVRHMTHGTSNEYYATDKDSRRILEQPYKWLRGRRLRRVTAFLEED